MKHRVIAILPFLAMALAACGHDDGRADAAPAIVASALVARGQVDVEGGTLALGLPVDGVIARVQAKEGASVRRDATLLEADATPARLDEHLAQAKLEQAQARLAMDEPKAAASALRARRLAEAARDGAADGQSADDAGEAAAEARAELADARAGVSVATAELERARYQVGQQVLRAPVDGEVLRVTAWPGMRATSGTALVTLLPASARIVRAELSQDAVARVAVAQTAQVLSDDGRQTPIAQARVLRLGRTFGQAVLQGDPMQRVNERSVECVLALEPPANLRVGQRVLVRFAAAALSPRVAKGR